MCTITIPYVLKLFADSTFEVGGLKKNSQFVFSWMHVVTKFILHICTIICNIIYVLKILEYHTDPIRSTNIGTVKVESSV